MRLPTFPNILGFICGVLLALAGVAPVYAVSNGPLGTQVAQFQRSVVNMVRDPVRPVIYATTTANSVIAINTSTMTMTELLIGSGPLGLDVSADGSRLYVANSGSTAAGIGVVDLTTFTALASLPTPFAVSSVAAGLNGHLFILGGNEGATLDQIDSTTGVVQATVAPQPNYLYSGKVQCSPDRKTLYYGNFGLSPSTLYAFDVSGATPTVAQITAFGTLGGNGEDLAITADGSALVYPNGGGQGNYQIFLIPTNNLNGIAGVFNVGAYPTNGAFSPDGSTFYTGPDGLTSGTVQVWSMTTFAQIASFTVPNFGQTQVFGPLLVDQSGQYLFAPTITPDSGPSGPLTVYATGMGVYPVITSPSSLNVDTGAAASFALTSNLSNVTWSATGLPAGLSLNATSGVISGTASATGSYNAKITAKETGGGSTAGTLAVTVQKVSGTVSAAGTQVAEIGRPVVAMIRDPNRPLIYATTANNTVLAVNVNTLLVTGEISIGSNPEGLAISPDGSTLYVANSGSTTDGIGVVDLGTFQALPSLATEFPVSSVAAGLNGHLYLVGPEFTAITQIDSTTGAVQATVPMPFSNGSAENLLLTPDGKTLFYGDSGNLLELNVSGAALAVTQTATASRGRVLVLTNDGSGLFCDAGNGIGLVPITNINSVLGSFKIDDEADNGALSPDGSTFYTAPDDDTVLQVWNTSTYLNTATFTVPGVSGLLVDPAGRYIFASTSDGDTSAPSSLMVYSTGTEITPTVTSSATLQADEGAPVNFTLTSKESGVTWSAINLPATLSLNPQSGLISGSEAIPGNYVVQVTATDRLGITANATLTITVLTSFTVQINGQGGLSSGSVGTTWVPLGSTYSLTAAAAAGYVFTAWTGAKTASTATISGTVTKDMTLTASFVPATTLTVTISGPGTVSQGFGGVTMQPLGSTPTIVAIPNTGARFLGWSGDVVSQQASINVTLNQPVNLTATFATIVLPTLTSPATVRVNEGAAVNDTLTAAESGVTWSATNLPSGLVLDAQTGAITGMVAVPGNYSVPVAATDAYQITEQATLTIQVLTSFTVAINGQGSLVGGTPGVSWLAIGAGYALTAIPESGNAFIGWTGAQASQAITISGTVQPDMTLTANFAATATLTAAVSGPGTVDADFAGTTTQVVGSSVTITATPGARAAFTGWTGDITSQQASLTFTLTQPTRITANFVSISTYAGSYVFSPDATAPAGPLTKLTATVNASGNLTGKLTYGGQVFAFSGAFPAAANYTAALRGKNGKSVGLQLSLNLTTGHPVMTAAVTDGGTAFSLPGYRTEQIPAGQTVEQAGKYTFLMPPAANAGTIGYGFGTASVSRSGAVTFNGMMGDGTAFTAAAKISDSGFVLLSAPLYGGKGFLNGFLQFQNVPGESDFDGALVWSQPVKTGTKTQANGTQTTVQATGSLFAPAKGSNLFSFSSGQVTFSNGGLQTPSSTAITLGAGNKVTAVLPDANALVCTLNAKTGAFGGSFVLPGTKTRRPFKGVVFLKNPAAAGWFGGTGPAGCGAVELTP